MGAAGHSAPKLAGHDPTGPGIGMRPGAQLGVRRRNWWDPGSTGRAGFDGRRGKSGAARILWARGLMGRHGGDGRASIR